MLLLAAPLFAALLAAQPQNPVFRTGAAWVRVDVQVGDKARLLGSLDRDDFLVYDEGEPRKILYFGRESEPIDIVLLLDVSGSMRRYLEQMAVEAGEALRQLAPVDRVAVMLYGRTEHLEEEFTTDRGRIIDELRDSVHEGAGLGSGTRTNAAIVASSAYIEHNARQESRRAILILTDNESMDFRMPDRKVSEALLDGDTVLNAIVVGQAKRPKPPRPGQYINPDFDLSDVFEIAEATGGQTLRTEHAGATFRELMEGIRTRYSVAYAAPPSAVPGTFRKIRVELSPQARQHYPHAWLRARTGYTVK